MNNKLVIGILLLVIIGFIVYGIINLGNFNKTSENNKAIIPTTQKANQNNTIKWQSYINNRFGFKISYPEDWPTGKESINGDGITINIGNPANQILVYGSNVPTTLTPQDTSITRKVLTLNNGKQVTSIKYTDTDGKIRFIVVFEENNKQYVFYCIVSESFYTQNEKLLEDIAKTLELTH